MEIVLAEETVGGFEVESLLSEWIHKLHVFPQETVTGQIYEDILDAYVFLHAVEDNFILQNNKSRSHMTRIMEDYLQQHEIQRVVLLPSR